MSASNGASMWSLPSNSGDKSLSLALINNERTASGNLLRIEFHDRAHWGAVPTREAGLFPDVCAVVEPVRIHGSAMEELLERMQGWLVDSNSFELLLSSEDDLEQSALIRLGPNSGFISSTDKPVVELEVRRGSTLVISWAFVVDQSCIREFIFGRS